MEYSSLLLNLNHRKNRNKSHTHDLPPKFKWTGGKIRSNNKTSTKSRKIKLKNKVKNRLMKKQIIFWCHINPRLTPQPRLHLHDFLLEETFQLKLIWSNHPDLLLKRSLTMKMKFVLSVQKIMRLLDFSVGKNIGKTEKFEKTQF